MTTLISFLRYGSRCPELQAMELGKQLIQVDITHSEDVRTLDQIREGTGLSNWFSTHHLNTGGKPIITIDYNCINRAERVWRKVHTHILFTLSGTAAVLGGLFTLGISRVITTRQLVLAEFAVAIFFIVVLMRAEEIYSGKPLFPDSYSGYTFQITQFRNQVIEKGADSLEKAKILLPLALRDRVLEFFTQNEKNLLGIVKSSEHIEQLE
jgi:hypothetical protein